MIALIGNMKINQAGTDTGLRRDELTRTLLQIVTYLENEANRSNYSLALINSGLIDLIIHYLDLDDCDAELKKIMAQFIAELAKIGKSANLLFTFCLLIFCELLCQKQTNNYNS